MPLADVTVLKRASRHTRLCAAYQVLYHTWRRGGDERVFQRLKRLIVLIDESAHAQ